PRIVARTTARPPRFVGRREIFRRAEFLPVFQQGQTPEGRIRMKISPNKQRKALAGALHQLLAQRGSSAIGDVGDYLLARLLAEDGGAATREAAAARRPRSPGSTASATRS